MREFEIFYKDVEIGEFPSPETEYMIRERNSDGSFVESYFKNGIDMLDFIDSHQLLRYNSVPVPIVLNSVM